MSSLTQMVNLIDGHRNGQTIRRTHARTANQLKRVMHPSVWRGKYDLILDAVQHNLGEKLSVSSCGAWSSVSPRCKPSPMTRVYSSLVALINFSARADRGVIVHRDRLFGYLEPRSRTELSRNRRAYSKIPEPGDSALSLYGIPFSSTAG